MSRLGDESLGSVYAALFGVPSVPGLEPFTRGLGTPMNVCIMKMNNSELAGQKYKHDPINTPQKPPVNGIIASSTRCAANKFKQG